jgi:hypothetical protein
MSCDTVHVAKVHEIMHSNHLAVQEIAKECNISIGSCHDIPMTKLEMFWVVSKSVSRLLTQDQRASHITICHKLLDCSSKNENLLKRIVTGDETSVYGYDVETKMQPSQWVRKNSPRPKKVW